MKKSQYFKLSSIHTLFIQILLKAIGIHHQIMFYTIKADKMQNNSYLKSWVNITFWLQVAVTLARLWTVKSRCSSVFLVLTTVSATVWELRRISRRPATRKTDSGQETRVAWITWTADCTHWCSPALHRRIHRFSHSWTPTRPRRATTCSALGAIRLG